VTPRVPEEGKLRANRRDPGPLIGVWDLLAPVRTYRRGGGSGAATCPADAGAGLPLEDSPTHRIQCGWLRRALPSRLAGQSLSVLTVDRVLPRYTVQSPAPHPRRAVCRINWIRRHDTFSSCRLRRKLHGRSATLQAAPHATPWRRFDKTGKARRSEDSHGQTREIRG